LAAFTSPTCTLSAIVVLEYSVLSELQTCNQRQQHAVGANYSSIMKQTLAPPQT